jgi:hypothetical protein
MNVRFKMTGKGEVAILPRKDYEALAAKAREADEDVGTARLVARAERDCGRHRHSRTTRSAFSPAAILSTTFFGMSGAVKRSSTSRTRLASDRAIFPTWKADGEGEKPQL